ncbi:MAG: hypothetical protein DI539_24780 [Flavobacterium psychrophilum]|nr:MAG: hypothetical protein DI539_24780 [Flavobacterium psychrophilum]
MELEFKLNWNELWEIFLELEQAELIDMHSQEIAKISDQVLGTYSFYKAFIDPATATISYSHWVTVFIEKYNSRIRNTFIDMVNTYDYYDMRDRAVALLAKVQQAVQKDANKLYLFFSMFWFYRDIDTLIFVQEWIELLEVEEFTPDNEVIIALPNDYQYATTFVDLLTPFWHQQLSLSRQAIEMGMQILAKQPSRLADMMKAFHENLSYHRFDYNSDYSRQQTLLDVLDQNSISPTDQYVRDQVFLIMADHYLEWEHTQVEGSGGGSMSIFTFTLVANDALCLLRKRVLSKIFSLSKVYKNKALHILEQYAWAGREFNPDVYKTEQALMATFILNELSPTNYRHCKLVKRYQQTLKDNGIEVLHDFSSFLQSPIMDVATLLTYDEDDFDLRDRENHKKEQLRSYIATMSIDDLESIFHFISNIDQNSNEEYALQLFMITLAEENIGLFSSAVDRIMKDDLKVSNNEGWFVTIVVSKNLVDVNSFYRQINSKLYKQKQIWKQAFFYALTQEHVSEYFLDEFIFFLKSLDSYYYAGDFDKYDKYTQAFLQKYPSEEHVNFVTVAAEILLEKSKETSIYFDRHVCEKSSTFFAGNIELLEKVYIHQATALGHYDYSGTELKAVCSLDRNFLVAYIQHLASEAKPLRFSIDKLHLSFVWEYDDHEAIIDKALGIVIEEAPPWSSFKHMASAFFRLDAGAVQYKEKMVQYIGHFISKYNHSKNHMVVIMNVVSGTFADMKMDFFRQMAIENPDPEIYRNMPFEQGGLAGSTLVPSIERQISFRRAQVDMLKTLPNPLRYAKLIQHYEEMILWLEDHKERELKKDFIGWNER